MYGYSMGYGVYTGRNYLSTGGINYFNNGYGLGFRAYDYGLGYNVYNGFNGYNAYNRGYGYGCVACGGFWY